MNLSDIIAGLGLESKRPSTPAELRMIEECSGLLLPDTFRELWLSVGGCDLVAKIMQGPKTGKYIASFWGADDILKVLREDYGPRSSTAPKVVPFGEDFFGNTLFLSGVGEYAGPVLVANWDDQTVELIADSFDEFLGSLQGENQQA